MSNAPRDRCGALSRAEAGRPPSTHEDQRRDPLARDHRREDPPPIALVRPGGRRPSKRHAQVREAPQLPFLELEKACEASPPAGRPTAGPRCGRPPGRRTSGAACPIRIIGSVVIAPRGDSMSGWLSRLTRLVGDWSPPGDDQPLRPSMGGEGQTSTAYLTPKRSCTSRINEGFHVTGRRPDVLTHVASTWRTSDGGTPICLAISRARRRVRGGSWESDVAHRLPARSALLD